MSYEYPSDYEISNIRKYISKGHFPQIAAVLAGVPKFKFDKWMSDSSRAGAHPQLIKLRANLECGDAALEDTAVENWVMAFGKDWKAAKEYLAIRFPERWDPSVNIQKAESEEDNAKKGVLELLNNPEARKKLEELKEIMKGAH